jgi:hypothetical protein
MSVTVKKIVLWRRELENRPGSLANSLKPLAHSGINLQILVGYAGHSDRKGAMEIYPIIDAKAEDAAKEAGLQPMSDVQCLLVEGEDSPGLAHRITEAIAEQAINLEFIMLTAIGGKFSGVFATKTLSDIEKVESIIIDKSAKAVHSGH